MILTLAALLILPLSLLANTPPQPDGEKAGRFQVVSGQVDHGSGAAPCFVRIDTMTGECWLLQQVPMPGMPMRSYLPVWIPMHEVNGELYQSIAKQMQAQQK